MASAAAAPETKVSKPPSYTIPVSTGHEDLIHGISFDYYGQRIATCSSDQTIKVFDCGEDGEWKENDAWRAHDANISKIAWAHPSFGQVLASCSFDRTVKIFEEQEAEPKNSGKRWKPMFRMIGDTRGAICDISFAPAYLGLKLAYISSDGMVQVQEAMETQTVSRWNSVDEFRVVDPSPLRESETSFCIDYCPSRWGGEQLLIGAMDKMRIYRHDSNGKFQPAEKIGGHKGLVRDVRWAPNLGRNYHLVASACKDGWVRIFRLTDPRMTFSSASAAKPSRPASRSKEYQGGGGSGVGAGVVGGGGDDFNEKGPSHISSLTKELSNLSAMSNGKQTTASVPSSGAASIIHSNSFEKQQLQQQQSADEILGVLTLDEQETRELYGFQVEEIAAFGDHGREVWRVEWNPSGTVLSSAGDDGKIRLWRADRTMRWKCMSVMSTSWRPTRRREDDDED